MSKSREINKMSANVAINSAFLNGQLQSRLHDRTREGVRQMPDQFVEEKVFSSEIKRIDSDISNIKKVR